jgi:hypothetical protein
MPSDPLARAREALPFKPLWKPDDLLYNNLKSCSYCLRRLLASKANETIHE